MAEVIPGAVLGDGTILDRAVLTGAHPDVTPNGQPPVGEPYRNDHLDEVCDGADAGDVIWVQVPGFRPEVWVAVWIDRQEGELCAALCADHGDHMRWTSYVGVGFEDADVLRDLPALEWVCGCPRAPGQVVDLTDDNKGGAISVTFGDEDYQRTMVDGGFIEIKFTYEGVIIDSYSYAENGPDDPEYCDSANWEYGDLIEALGVREAPKYDPRAQIKRGDKRRKKKTAPPTGE